MASTLVRDHRGIPRGERLFAILFIIPIVMFFIIYFVLCIVDAVGVFFVP